MRFFLLLHPAYLQLPTRRPSPAWLLTAKSVETEKLFRPLEKVNSILHFVEASYARGFLLVEKPYFSHGGSRDERSRRLPEWRCDGVILDISLPSQETTDRPRIQP